MPLEQRHHDRNDVAELLEAMSTWEPPGGHVAGLHVGDVGWHLRMSDEEIARTLTGWWRGGRLVAAAIVEPGLVRPRLAPDCHHDAEVCAAVADVVDGVPDAETGQAASEAQSGSLLRTMLVSRGWSPDPAVWTALYVDLGSWTDPMPDRVEATGDHVEDRVTVQRNGFDRSTFTAEAWRRMAAGPGFDPALDLVARNEEGVAVAAGTAWSAGPDRCGILEPVSTHREHRRQGHGRRLIRGCLAALAAAGASGASVCTPSSNSGAVDAYVSAGMRPVETLQDLTRPRPTP